MRRVAIALGIGAALSLITSLVLPAPNVQVSGFWGTVGIIIGVLPLLASAAFGVAGNFHSGLHNTRLFWFFLVLELSIPAFFGVLYVESFLETRRKRLPST